MLYNAFKHTVAILFNLLNRLMFGNLPPFGSACVIVEEQGRFLVLKRPTGTAAFPGGFMRWNELAEETARREAKEETGLDLQIAHMVSYSSTPSTDFKHMSTLTLFFHASVIAGELRTSIEGQPCWLDEETLRGCLHSYYQDALDDYLRYRSQTISSHETTVPLEKGDYETPTFFQIKE